MTFRRQLAMRNALHWLLLLCATMAAAAAFGDTPAPETTQVDRLMERSGMTQTLRQIRPSVLSGMGTGQADLPQNITRAMVLSAEQAFQAERMIGEVRAFLAAHLSPQELDDVLQWLDTPLGQRTTALENAASSPEGQARMIEYARRLKQQPPSRERLALCNRLNQITHASELMHQLFEAAMLAGAAGVNAAQPAERQLPPETMRRLLEREFATELAQIEPSVTLTLLFTYAPLSDAELRQYLAFLEVPPGSRYIEASSSALRQVVIDSLGRFMQYLPAAIRAGESARDT